MKSRKDTQEARLHMYAGMGVWVLILMLVGLFAYGLYTLANVIGFALGS